MLIKTEAYYKISSMFKIALGFQSKPTFKGCLHYCKVITKIGLVYRKNYTLPPSTITIFLIPPPNFQDVQFILRLHPIARLLPPMLKIALELTE